MPRGDALHVESWKTSPGHVGALVFSPQMIYINKLHLGNAIDIQQHVHTVRSQCSAQATRESVDLCFAISDGLRMHNGTLIGADDVASRLIGHNVFLRSESDTYRHGNTLLRR